MISGSSQTNRLNRRFVDFDQFLHEPLFLFWIPIAITVPSSRAIALTLTAGRYGRRWAEIERKIVAKSGGLVSDLDRKNRRQRKVILPSLTNLNRITPILVKNRVGMVPARARFVKWLWEQEGDLLVATGPKCGHFLRKKGHYS